MKTLQTLLLGLFLAAALGGCIEITKTERRVVELPAGDPRTTLATAEQICRELLAGGFGREVQAKFPALKPEQLQGLFLNWNEGVFSGAKSIFITTGVNYGGELPQAKEIADFCEAAVRRAVAAKFSNR